MRRRTLITTVGAILGTSVGAAAYTSASTSRNATFSVAADSGTALIGLAAGASPQITNNGDKLDVSLQNLNTDSTFTFGDTASLDTAYAFSITNNDTVSHDITVGYNTAGVTFNIYEQGATDWTDAVSVGVVDSATDVTLTAAAAGKEFRVVMTVDTTGIGSTSTALDGVLSFASN